MSTTDQSAALDVVIAEMEKAVAARRCHKCGCFQQTVEALAETEAGGGALRPLLTEARRLFTPKQYDCLGCPVCYPAIAANAFADAYPSAGANLELCPTEEPEARTGWPPLPGDYSVVRFGAPVAVCVLNSTALAQQLFELQPDGLAIVGTMQTENLGIERVIRNTVANPNIRFLVLCGEDTRQSVGHLPGQSFAALFHNGFDEKGRIIGAPGRRPLLKNVGPAEVAAFREQVELVAMIGETNPHDVAEAVRLCAGRDPGPCPQPFDTPLVERTLAGEPKRLTLDPAGYFVVYPESRSKRLVLEHYTNEGLLDCVLEGTSTGALYSEAIARQLLTRLDHAAYLGRELARAEKSMQDGTPFVQDAAPGRLAAAEAPAGCSSSCGCSSAN